MIGERLYSGDWQWNRKMRAYHKRSMFVTFCVIVIISLMLIVRLYYLMIVRVEHYGKLARDVQERERSIKAQRGRILDCHGVELASNKPVSTISVIYNQVKEPEKVIQMLSEELLMEEAEVRKKVEKRSSREKIKSNVEKEIGDRIRKMHLAGVVVDEDYKRYYPYKKLASKLLGFTGADNQGIIGLEVKYDQFLQGENGVIYTKTNAKGVALENQAERRKEPVSGCDLYTSIDVNIQQYAWQAAKKVKEEKKAKSVRLVLLNPQNGEIYAMVNEPEFDLNQPYKISGEATMTKKEKTERLNEMWRNGCVSDSYEPGSTFKIITATAALSEDRVRVSDQFFCAGSRKVEDRSIRCHKTTGHGAETFREGFMNSCNPVFMEVAERTGVDRMFAWYEKLGLREKTGVDLPGEAGSIFHKKENVKAVELATMAFGQSIQVTPLQLIRAAASLVNGGKLITPHIGVRIVSEDGSKVRGLTYTTKSSMVSRETQQTMGQLLEAVVAEGGGSKAYVEGYRIGGKTATSEKLPRGTGKYIASFLGIATVDDPKVIGLILIDEPKGTYYGGTIAAPVMGDVFKNIMPYLGIKGNCKR